MASRKQKNVTTIDAFDEAGVGTLEEYFDKLEKGFEELKNWRINNDKDIAKKFADAQKSAMTSAINQIAETNLKLQQAGVKDVENYTISYRKKILADFEKKRRQDELKLLEDVQKAKYKLETEQDRKRKAQERRDREQENKEKLDFYEQLRAKNIKLTSEQLADETRARNENRLTSNERSLNKAFDSLAAAMSKLDSHIDKYSQYSAGINARLQGSGSLGERLTWGQNRFGAIESNLSNAIGVNPYFKTETMLDNLQSLVEAGIASNIEQRAFLQTAKDDIATTFDVANGALLRIIRLQQSDSTAARLGMEAYLTRFLNELVENTEYLTTTFDTVQEALLEASSFMESKASTEFEYVVQKWLGALSGVGLSEGSAANIAQALGALGSGNIEALSGTSLQNLLVMAASRTGLNYADLLSGGLTAQSTDTLMRGLVDYMVEIGNSDSNVVKSQFAQTFGLNFSDLRAAQQLSASLNDITGNLMSYESMYGELGYQLNSLPQRLNMATMLDNLWDNLEFGLASNVAKNPALAAIWKVTDLIQQNTGGINIPSIMAMGSGFDLNTTIENLVKMGVVGIGSLGMIGDLISGISSTLVPSSMLAKLGINSSSTAITRGTGLGGRTSGLSTSTSVKTVSTSSGEDIGTGELTKSEDSAKEAVTSQQEEDNTLGDIKTYLVETFDAKFTQLVSDVSELKEKVVNGEVEVSNYSQPGMNPLSPNYGGLLF